MKLHQGMACCLLVHLWASSAVMGQQPEAINNPAYEKTLKEIQESKTLAYTVTFFTRGKDGTLQVSAVAKSEHRKPGLYRETRLDMDRNEHHVEIVDTVANKTLLLDMKARTATWMDRPINIYGPGSPLEMLAKFVAKTPKEVAGQRDTSEGKADVFRLKGGLELWFDTESKDLIGFSMSRDEDFSPQLSDLGKPLVRRGGRPVGQVRSNIQYGINLGEDRFEMVVPDGFTLNDPPPAPKR